MSLAFVSLSPPVASPCFSCRAYIFSFSPSPLRLYFRRGDKKPPVRSVRTESDGAKLLRQQRVSSGEEESSEESDEFVDWEDKILEGTVPLVGFIRMILHSGNYANRDRLSPEHEITIVEMLFHYHPEVDKKTGCGIII